MIDIGLVVLILVLFNLGSMLFCFKDFKRTKEDNRPFPMYQVYLVSSLLFAAFGVLICVLALRYRGKDKLFILLHVLILAIQIVGLVFLIPVLT